MPHTQRVRIVVGFWALIIGAVIAVIGPVVPMHGAISQIDPNALGATTTALNDATELASLIAVGGSSLAIAGLVLVAFEWTRAFIGKPST